MTSGLFGYLSGSHLHSQTLKVTSTKVVETSYTNNSSFQNCSHLDDRTIPTIIRSLILREGGGEDNSPELDCNCSVCNDSHYIYNHAVMLCQTKCFFFDPDYACRINIS